MKKENKSRDSLFILIAAAVLLIGLILFLKNNAADRNDMLVFRPLVADNSLIEFLELRYHTTARCVLEIILYGIIKAPYCIFAGITIVIVFTGIAVLKYLLNWNLWTTSVAMILLLLFPYKSLCEAGIQPVVINYIWAFVFGLIGMIPIRRILNGGKIRWFDYLKYGFPLIIACNMEQVAAIVLGFYIIFLVYAAIEKVKDVGLAISQTVISLLSVLYLLFGPGNLHRLQASIEVCWPGFEELSIFDKVWNGYCSTLNYYFAIVSFLFTIFSASTVLLLILQKKRLKSVVGIIPSLWLIFVVGCKILEKLMRINILNYFAAVIYTDTGFMQTEMQPVMGIIILYSILFLLIVFAFSSLRLGKKEKTVYSLILLAGLASRLLMGFSPTLLASGTRTFCYCTLAIWICASYLLANGIENLHHIYVRRNVTCS